MIVSNATPLLAFARIDALELLEHIVRHLLIPETRHLGTLLPPFIYRHQRPRRLRYLLAQALRLQYLGVGAPLQHPPAHFAGLTDLNCENKTAVGKVVDLL